MRRARNEGSVAYVRSRRRRRRGRLAALGLAALLCLSVTIYAFADTERDEFVAEEPPVAPETQPVSNEPEQDSTGKDSPNIEPPAGSCDDLKALVDRERELPPGYEPTDLVSLMAHGVPTVYGQDLLARRAAVEPLGELTAAAAADGEELVALS
ncbi:MAG: hypothetical protein ACRDSJ_02660, partial [Rubrobacteraceae bacterium]